MRVLSEEGLNLVETSLIRGGIFLHEGQEKNFIICLDNNNNQILLTECIDSNHAKEILDVISVLSNRNETIKMNEVLNIVSINK